MEVPRAVNHNTMQFVVCEESQRDQAVQSTRIQPFPKFRLTESPPTFAEADFCLIGNPNHDL